MQAKSTYKKYEDYLDNADDLLRYSLKLTAKTNELIPSVMEHALLGTDLNFREFFRESSEEEVLTKINYILDKFTKSSFFKKKKLFNDIRKQFKQ